MNSPLLTLEGVHTHIGAYHILHGVNLSIPRGQLTMLLGRNGAGKTSLMRIITGEETPNSGEIIRPAETMMTRLEQDIPDDLQGSVLDVIHSGLRPDSHEEQWQSDIRLEELAAEMKLSVESDALVMPSSNGRPIAGRPPFERTRSFSSR